MTVCMQTTTFFVSAFVSDGDTVKTQNLIKGHQSWCTKQLARAVWLANIVKQIHVSPNKAAQTHFDSGFGRDTRPVRRLLQSIQMHMSQCSLTLLSFNSELSTNIAITGTVDNPIGTNMLLAYLLQILSRRKTIVLISYLAETFKFKKLNLDFILRVSGPLHF